MKKSQKLAAVAVVAIAIIVAFVAFRQFNPFATSARFSAADTMEQTKAKIRKVVEKHQKSKPAEAKPPKRKIKSRMTHNGSLYDHLPAEERRLAEAVRAAFEDDNFEGVKSAAEKALKCDNPEVRRDAVEALAWFGEKALPELTMLMSDKDEDIAQAAIDGWEQGLSEIEEPGDRLNISYLALSALQDANALEVIGSQFSYAASEYIDSPENEDKQHERRVEVVQSLVDMIASPNAKTSKAGKELYEEVTGNRWINFEEAQKYVADPDKYEEPD